MFTFKILYLLFSPENGNLSQVDITFAAPKVCSMRGNISLNNIST